MSGHGHDRIPPQNLEAEMALLGAVLVDARMFEVALEQVTPSDFYASFHETIFLALSALFMRGAPLDKVALAEELRNRGMLDRIGGFAYLNSLMDTVPTAASVGHYASIVREKAGLRDLIRASAKIQEIAYGSEGDLPGAFVLAEQELSSVTTRGTGALRLDEPEDRIARIVDSVSRREKQPVILSPWAGVNRRVGGFAPGELIVIPAPPMTGKTGLAITLSDFIAERFGPTLVASIEMGDVAIDRRRIAQRANASSRAQRLDELTTEQRQRVYVAGRDLSPLALYVTGQQDRSIAALHRNAREIVRRRGYLAAAVIDHVLFLDEAKPRGRATKNEALDEVYQRLIAFATEFACPVFALIHLNRAAGTGRPTFASLMQIRDGGNVEGHAHTVIFPWREDPMGKPTVGELVIVKSRDGDSGWVPMFFDGARALWCEANPDGFPIAPWFERARAPDDRSVGMDFTATSADDARPDDEAPIPL